MHHMCAVVVLLVVFAAPASAQIQSRPTDPPLVTAVNESWYQLREPVQFAGELYYPAGATVFFNGNVMVRTGHYNGIPLYTDATIEPFSIVLVPVSRGLMQPYERPRRGDLAGTSGSRVSSFPVRPTPDAIRPPMAAVAPTAAPLPTGAISVYTPASTFTAPPADRPVGGRDNGAPLIVGTTGYVATARPQDRIPILSMRRPANNDGVWIQFGGEKWVSAGTAVPLVVADFVRVGEYAGFPVFARRELTQEVIYLPSLPGLIAPYRLKN
jgi:hypothetical protein